MSQVIYSFKCTHPDGTILTYLSWDRIAACPACGTLGRIYGITVRDHAPVADEDDADEDERLSSVL